ncbi:MAG: ABC transporter permease [Ruminococcaceae bacterium]|nr:ABC transporter permease [Oscillospiraceae bacterium]
MKLWKRLSYAYSVLIFLFLYAPIVVMIVYSFNAEKSRAKWGGFTLKWYRELFSNSDIMEALITTLTIALLSSIIALIIGTAAAVGIANLRKGPRKWLMNITYLPMLNADIVTGVSLLLIFSLMGIELGYVSLLLAHVTFNIPYVILSIMPKLRQLDPHLYEAAQDLGAPPVLAFFKVVLPEISPGIVTGFLLAFTMSIDDFVISFFTTGSGVSTLAIEIYSMARRGIKPEINALSAIMFLVVLALLLVINLRGGKDKKGAENRPVSVRARSSAR